jgi:type II secretory ATPase GspE/PulE/Tfp pilus assembly ATPase PilB-like protein
LGKYAAEERRRLSEWPLHRSGTKFADWNMPNVVLTVDGEGQGEDDAQPVRDRPALRPAAPVAEVEKVDLPPNYFQTEDANKDTWLEEIVQECVKMGASDLLLTSENQGFGLTAAARVDGRMRPVRRVDGGQAKVIVGKFRAENGLATSGTSAPQETQYSVEVDGEERKARVAVFKKADGCEAIAMRLPPSGKLRGLSELSFSDDNLDAFHHLLSSSNGMLVIAGPMGEGKTTTAQAAVMHVATGSRTVWTVEDPVERVLPGTIQLEVDPSQQAGYDVPPPGPGALRLRHAVSGRDP